MCHVPEAQCTPSRAALLTGRFAIRSGTHAVPLPGAPDGLTRWEVTLAEALSAACYATAHFGKWCLGSAQGRLPNRVSTEGRKAKGAARSRCMTSTSAGRLTAPGTPDPYQPPK